MAVGLGGLSIAGRDPHPISQNRFWKLRTRHRPLEGLDRTADGLGLVGLAGWVGFACCLDSPTYYVYYQDVFISKVMLCNDSLKPYWKKKFIDDLPHLFAHVV